jgi:ubiquinone/menaquinone biosynthesis C-methylase UbiE
MKREEIQKHEASVFHSYESLAQRILQRGYRHNAMYLARKAVVDWFLLTSIDITGKRILNVGCFEPIDEIVWSGPVQEWVAVDVSPASIKTARKIVNLELAPRLAKKVKFAVMDAQKLEFKDEAFDVAVSFSVLDHIPDPGVRDRAIQEMARVVKTGGHVIITVPNRYAYFHMMYRRNVRRGIAMDVGYQYFYSYWELKKKMIQAGLRPVRFTSDMKNVGDLPKWMRGLLMPFVLFGDRMGILSQKI